MLDVTSGPLLMLHKLHQVFNGTFGPESIGNAASDLSRDCDKGPKTLSLCTHSYTTRQVIFLEMTVLTLAKVACSNSKTFCLHSEKLFCHLDISHVDVGN